MYPMVTHSLQDALSRALGLIQVSNEETPKTSFEAPPPPHDRDVAWTGAADR
jgi:hypothetical protein